jgi:uncharacterized protein YoxC
VAIVLSATIFDIILRNKNVFEDVDLKKWTFITINDEIDDISEMLNDNDSDSNNKLLGKSEKEHSLGVKIFLSFSAYTNSIKLFTVKKQEGQLECLNGIRTLSLSW